MNKEENTLTIETYLSWKNKRFAVKDFIKESLKELENYKSRIDRAIEYIEEYQDVLKEHNGDWLNYQDGFKPYLLKILKGSEE